MIFICPVYQSHLLRGRCFVKMESVDFQTKHYPSEEGTQQHLLKSLQRKHTQTHASIIPLYTPPCVACLCFCLCKITVVQVSSRQSNADRQACKRTAKHLCSPQRSFLSYNWLSCPTCGFGYKTRSSSRSPLHLPEEHRGRWKVLSKMSGKVASSFKGPWMYMAHEFLC